MKKHNCVMKKCSIIKLSLIESRCSYHDI